MAFLKQVYKLEQIKAEKNEKIFCFGTLAGTENMLGAWKLLKR